VQVAVGEQLSFPQNLGTGVEERAVKADQQCSKECGKTP
jgi:hypothetical protein